MALSIQEAPRHNIINSHFDTNLSSITAMCNVVRFEICVSMEDIEGSCFEYQYRQLVEKVHGGEDESIDDYEELCDWIMAPCFPHLRDLAPPIPKDRILSLQDFYYPQTYYLMVFSSTGRLDAKRQRKNKAASPNPLMIPTSTLPRFGQIRLFKASEILIVSDDDSDDHLCEIPRLIRTEDGTLCYFKPSFDASQFLREIEILSLIAKADLSSSARVSSLRGLVTSDDGLMMIGLLVDWIPSIGDLHSEVCTQAQENHDKWERQIQETVQELHKNDIIWGDVHPGNILVDKELNAWVIDFGGGNVDEFVERNISVTKDGDWQGVQKVFAGLRRPTEASESR